MTVTPALRGILWMLASVSCFSAMIIAVRFLADTLPPFQQVFLRSLISLLIVLPTMTGGLRGITASFRPDRVGATYLVRALCTFVGVSAWFFALVEMPLAEAVALHFTLPIFALIFAALILRERVTRARWLAVALGFAGVLIILRPGIAAFDAMALAVFLSAAGYAGGDIGTKMLARTEQTRLIVFNLNLYLVVFAAIPAVMVWQPPALEDWPMILFMGGTAYAAHMCLAQAFRAADASAVIPIEFVRLPITSVSAWYFFAQVPDIWTLIGAVVIFVGTWHVTVREHRRA